MRRRFGTDYQVNDRDQFLCCTGVGFELVKGAELEPEVSKHGERKAEGESLDKRCSSARGSSHQELDDVHRRFDCQAIFANAGELIQTPLAERVQIWRSTESFVAAHSGGSSKPQSSPLLYSQEGYPKDVVIAPSGQRWAARKKWQRDETVDKQTMPVHRAGPLPPSSLLLWT